MTLVLLHRIWSSWHRADNSERAEKRAQPYFNHMVALYRRSSFMQQEDEFIYSKEFPLGT